MFPYNSVTVYTMSKGFKEEKSHLKKNERLLCLGPLMPETLHYSNFGRLKKSIVLISSVCQ